MTDKCRIDELKYELAYESAMSMLRELMVKTEGCPSGFLASGVNIDNYKRFFARDTFWMGMASILSGDKELIRAYRNNLELFMKTQRSDGAMPSNISCEGKVSYGKKPRIDSTILFIIGCAEYYKYSGELRFLENVFEAVERAIKYLEDTWEDKGCWLLYIPEAGDWADEYIQQGFVLYDEVLWYIALKGFSDMLKALEEDDRSLRCRYRAESIKDVLQEMFWINNALVRHGDKIYNSIKKKFDFEKTGYFLHFYFAKYHQKMCFRESHGTFDAFGNALSMLAGIADDEQAGKIAGFIDEISINRYPMVPAHFPFFHESKFRSRELHQYRFKEFLGEYHNGGLWPWYMGVFVAGLARIKDEERAHKYLDGILSANMESRDGMNYYEFHTARKASAELTVTHEEGLNKEFSSMMRNLLLTHKPTFQIELRDKVIDVDEEICMSCFLVKKGEGLKINVVGPDAEDLMGYIASSTDKSGRRYFGVNGINSNISYPSGTPCMGVSAASYIIAHKALDEKKILFDL